MGIKMKRVAKGVDFDEVEEREGVKSISRHITFDRRHRRPRKNCHVRRYACRWCTQQPDEKSLPLRTVTYVVRLNNFSTFTQAKTVPVWTSDINVIKKTAMELLSEFQNRKLRLVGVGVSKLRERGEKLSLIHISEP